MDRGIEFLFVDQEKLWDSLKSSWEGKENLESSVRQAADYALKRQVNIDFGEDIFGNYFMSVKPAAHEQLESYLRDYLGAKNFLVGYLRQIVGEDNQFLLNDLEEHDKDFKKGDFRSLFFRDELTEYDGFGRFTINKTRKFAGGFNGELYDEEVFDLMLNLLKERGERLLSFLEKNRVDCSRVSSEFKSNINISIHYFNEIKK